MLHLHPLLGVSILVFIDGVILCGFARLKSREKRQAIAEHVAHQKRYAALCEKIRSQMAADREQEIKDVFDLGDDADFGYLTVNDLFSAAQAAKEKDN